MFQGIEIVLLGGFAIFVASYLRSGHSYKKRPEPVPEIQYIKNSKQKNKRRDPKDFDI